MDLNQFGVWHVSRTDGCVVIEPDIFDGAVIPIEVGARTLPAQRWRDDDALRAALREAPVVTLKGLVSGQR
jgi:hypothetical protein